MVNSLSLADLFFHPFHHSDVERQTTQRRFVFPFFHQFHLTWRFSITQLVLFVVLREEVRSFPCRLNRHDIDDYIAINRNTSRCIADTDDFLVLLFEKLNMHKKRRKLHGKGSRHQIEDVGTSTSPFGSCLSRERKDRIGRKYVYCIEKQEIQKRKRSIKKPREVADQMKRKYKWYHSFSRCISDVKILIKIDDLIAI